MLSRSGYLRAPVDPAPLARLEREPLERLRDPEHLAGELLPAMGLSGHAPEVFPAELQHAVGRGVQHFQLPIQFGPYLADISGESIESYLEIGVEYGGTFAVTVEVLRRFTPLRQAVAVDFGPIPSLLDEHRRTRPEVAFVAIDSQSPGFRDFVEQRGPWDLVFIDGDHSEDGCRHDFESVHGKARMIAFHDIAEPGFPGVARVWQWVREHYGDEYDFREYVDQYPAVERAQGPHFGIGLALRTRT